MPLISPEQELAESGLNVGQFADAARAERMKALSTERVLPTFQQGAKAAFETENDIVAPIVSDSFGFLDDAIDPNFFVYENLTEEERTSSMMPDYARAMNASQLEAIRSDVKRNTENRKLLEERPAGGLAETMLAGIASPLTLLPGTALIKGEKVAATAGARAAKGLLGEGSAQVAKSAAGTAGIAVASIGASETILHLSDPTRTAEQSVMAMTGAAVLGGILGGVSARLSKADFEKLAAKLEQGVNEAPVVKPSPALSQFMDSVGAARVQRLGLDDLSISGKFASNVSYATRFLNPFNRLINSPFTASREMFVNIAENSLVLNMHKRGMTTGASAETLQKQFDKYQGEAIVAIKNGFSAIKKAEKANGKVITDTEYRERVSRAMRNGDVDPDYPEVTATAQALRKIDDAVTQQGKDAGLFAEKLITKGASSHLYRMWSKAKLLADPVGGKQILRRAAENLIASEKQHIQQSLAGISRMYEKRISDIMGRKARAEKILAEEKASTKIVLSAVSEYEDSLKDFLGAQIKETEVANYLSENGLEEVANAVNIVNSKMPKKPTGLYEFAKKHGGLIDENGELENLGIRFGRKKIYQNEGQTSLMGSGDSMRGAGRKITLDEFGERAVEAGYYAERPAINDLLDDLADDFNEVSPRYSVNDSDEVDNFIMTRQAKEEADAFLSELPEVNPKQFWPTIKKEILDKKGLLGKEKKALAQKAKDIREGARRVRTEQEPLRVEVKKLRNAREAAAKKILRDSDSMLKKLNERKEMKRLKYEERGRVIADDGEADLMADDIYSMLVGADGDVPDWVSPVTRGVFKGKSIPIDDNAAEAFLENDIVKVMANYIRQASGDISLSSKFGNPRMVAQLEELKEEYLIKLADPSLKPKERRKLEKQYAADRRDLEALRDIIRGTYNKTDPDSLIATGAILIRDATYWASMGSVLLSSLSDTSMHVISHGIKDVFGTIPKLASLDKELSKLRIEDLKEAGLLYENILTSRMMTLADITDPNDRVNALTRGSAKISQAYSKATLINYWNDANKGFDGSITQQNIIKSVIKGDKIAPEEITELARLGISKKNARIIAEQFEKHGVKTDDGLYISGLSRWDSDTKELRQAAREFAAATRKSSDATIITGGISEKPLMARTVVGSIPFQFTSYMFAAHQKLMLANMQDIDASAVFGLLSMTVMGGIIAALKQKELELSYEIQGREFKGVKLKDWDTAQFIFQGVDRANPAPLLFDINNRYEKLGGYGLSKAMGVEGAARYASRSPISVFAGPAGGYFEGLVKTGMLPFKDSVTQNDLHQARKLAPGQNIDIIGLRFLFDAIEGKINRDMELQK